MTRESMAREVASRFDEVNEAYRLALLNRRWGEAADLASAMNDTVCAYSEIASLLEDEDE